MAIRIITDSPSDITIKEGKKLKVDIVPLKIIFDGKSYREEVDLTMEEFYKKLDASKELPTTSTPSPEDYLTYYNDAKKAGDSVIVITLSAGISGTYQCANLAKDMADYSNIHVIDSMSATVGQRLLVEYAVKLRDESKSVEEIIETIENAKHRVVFFAVVDTLKNLHKGGRLSKGVTIAGTILKVKPIITLKDGTVSLIEKARGFNGSVKTVTELIHASGEIDTTLPVYFGYSDTSDLCTTFREKITEKFNLTNTNTYPVGGVIGTHVGPGAYVMCYLKK